MNANPVWVDCKTSCTVKDQVTFRWPYCFPDVNKKQNAICGGAQLEGRSLTIYQQPKSHLHSVFCIARKLAFFKLCALKRWSVKVDDYEYNVLQ